MRKKQSVEESIALEPVNSGKLLTREEWDTIAAEDYEGIRKIADLLESYLRNYYQKEDKTHGTRVGEYACVAVELAITDCLLLDLKREAGGMPPIYLSNLELHNELVFKAIHSYAYAQLAELIKAHQLRQCESATNSEDFLSRHVLSRIRELLRDGHLPGYALNLYSDEIHELARSDKPRFFEKLGPSLREHRLEPKQRDVQSWIVRLWLPLRLWECPKNGLQFIKRFNTATDLLGVEPVAGTSESKAITLKEAWKKVRPRLGERKIPKSDSGQSPPVAQNGNCG